MNDYHDPKCTLKLLDELESLGLSNDEFAIIHHMGEKASISVHRSYCAGLKGHFRLDAHNAMVCRRLEAILLMARDLKIQTASGDLLIHLARAASLRYPSSAADPRCDTPARVCSCGRLFSGQAESALSL